MQQPELSHNEQAAQQRAHLWEQHVLFVGVHVEAAALALAAGAHPTRILCPPQQCLPYLLHSCLHTQQLQIEGGLQFGDIDSFSGKVLMSISSQSVFVLHVWVWCSH